jgi:DNA polymerase II small subunit/DNA polymerase delta subunit B
VDRQSNKVIAFKVGNENISNAYKMTYEILSNHSSDYTINNEQFNTTINYLCTDGHHAYDKVFNTYKDNIDKHIVSKSETCLVESYNSSMRDRLARLHRKSKAYSKSIYMLTISVNLWANKDIIFANIDKYCGYNEYTNNLVPVKHLRILENDGADERVA